MATQTPVFLPGESQGQTSLVGCRLWGRTGSDTTEVTSQWQSVLHKLRCQPCPSCISREHSLESRRGSRGKDLGERKLTSQTTLDS